MESGFCESDSFPVPNVGNFQAPVDEIDDLHHLLTCSMCSETLNEPRCLPCCHNFCKACLGRYSFFS